MPFLRFPCVATTESIRMPRVARPMVLVRLRPTLVVDDWHNSTQLDLSRPWSTAVVCPVDRGRLQAIAVERNSVLSRCQST